MRSTWLLAFFLAACSQASPEKQVFEAAGCLSCHRVGAHGGDSGPDLTFVGFRRSPEWLEMWLKDPREWKHDTLMPYMRLGPASRRALVAYLGSLRGQEAPGREEWSGKDVYLRAGCVACHGAGGRGGHPNNNVPGSAIPALDVIAGTYTRDELIRKISLGSHPAKADPAGPEPMVSMPAWKDALSPREIEAVADYLLSKAKKNDEF